MAKRAATRLNLFFAQAPALASRGLELDGAAVKPGAMAIATASRAYSFCNGRLVLSGEIVPILYYAETDEVWMRAKQIHTFTGATTMAHTLQRVDENDKSSLKRSFSAKGCLQGVVR
jgi:hypothetical protein